MRNMINVKRRWFSISPKTKDELRSIARAIALGAIWAIVIPAACVLLGGIVSLLTDSFLAGWRML